MKLGVALLAVALWALQSAAPSAAQQRPPAQQPPDTTKLPPDVVLRNRQREMLGALARPPGQDTIDQQPLDSLAAPGLQGQLGAPGQQPGIVSRPPPEQRTPPIAGDSLAKALLDALPGYSPVQYEAIAGRFEAASRDLYLLGDSARKVSVLYNIYQVTADTSIHYNQFEEVVEARGNPVYTPPGGDPVTSRRLLVDARTQQASAFGAETRYNAGATWYVEGDLPRVMANMVYATSARFTSCTLTVPHFHFHANRVKIVSGNIMVAAPVTLRFADVPVMWVPFIAQSLSRGRASGLLTPRFSINDVVRSSGGYERRISNVGFYWAMSDYTDATVALDWFSGNFTALTGSFRYRYLPQFLQGTVSARQFWPSEGGREFSLNGNHSWQLSERTSMNASVAFVTSAAFVRRNTFDPLEATQQITSSGGFTRRFDWGQLNVLGNRSQSLSDDRVDMTLPRATLSLKPITLFSAPTNREAWYNNMTWSGGGSMSRRSLDFPDQVDTLFFLQRADQEQTDASVQHSLSIRSLSISQSINYREGAFFRVPSDTLRFSPDPTLDFADLTQATYDLSMGVSYQQKLIGATSITPNVTVSRSSLRNDSLPLAQNFVSGPTRISFGANLSSQIYGFFPGFGPFEAMRHRLSPSVGYQWAPEVDPTELQRRVFGASRLQPQSQMTIGLSQTFEAKRRPQAVDTVAPALPPADQPLAPDSIVRDSLPPGVSPDEGPGAPTRREQGQIVTLLSLNTSSVTYDFVEADSAGDFLLGFQTTRLRNEIASDYLRGLSLSIEHDIFFDSITSLGEGRFTRQRTFSPHLSSVNLRFALNARSALLRWLGLAPTGEPPTDAARFDPEDPFAERRSVTDEASIIPGQQPPIDAPPRQNVGQRQRRDWNAGITYALTRPRGPSALVENAQTLRVSFSAQPTDLWTMSWRTSYDVNSRQFSDHMVTLTRDMHEWQAHFDFLKTATGNWAFRFEVQLLDLPDLHFDFDQQSVESEGGIRIPPPS